MTKAALILLGLAALLAVPAAAMAQDNNSTAIAVNEAVLRQANTIVLRQKLAAARHAEQAGETIAAAKLYQESCELVGQIGSGVDPEASQAVNGLANTRLALAREDQARGNYRDAANQAQQVLNVDSKNPAALAFKKQNDELIVAMKGQIPSAAAVEQASQITGQKVDAGTFVQDGRLLYEMGKLDDAEIKLNQALALNPDNPAAFYYLNLIEQARFARESAQHNVDTQKRMAKVEKQWILPTSKLTSSNPYATNTLIYTGPGRQAIVSKLDHIRLDSVSYDGLPLSEVLRNLTEQSKLRDPEHRGINFLINSNPDLSGKAVEAAPVGGVGGVGGLGGQFAPTIDPATGLPAAPAAPAGGGGGEALDVGAFIVKIPNLTDVRMADILDAIVLVTDHPVKYSVQDFAVVFSQKGAETPQLFSRVFKVDPNTFYSGLESVGSSSFGSVNSGGNSGGGGNGGGNGGGGNNSNGGNQNNSGAVVGVVNAFAGAGGLRSSGNSNGNGGGGQGGQGGASNPLAGGGGRGGVNGGGGGGQGGLQYITQVTLASTPSEAARSFFTALGVNLEQPPGKSVFFNDRLGKLFVKATEQDLDTIERAIETLNEVAPQVHIKARFIEVQQNDNKALGFDWYLGQFGHSVVAQGGNPGSLTVPANSANPLGAFPGATAANTIPDSGQSLFSSGLTPTAGATTATITGILTNPNFQLVIHALQQRQGFEALAEPEVTTTSGRQTQMRATQVQTIITGYNFQQGSSASSGNNNGN